MFTDDAVLEVGEGLGASLPPAVDAGGPDYYKCKLLVQAMTCASCVATIESQISKMAGVKSVLVALMAGKAEVLYDPSIVQPGRISAEISKLGFPCSVLEEREERGESEVTISIGGMTCSSCVHSIETKLSSQPGVSAVSVALATQRGKIKSGHGTVERKFLFKILDLILH